MIKIKEKEVRNFPHEYNLAEWEKQMDRVQGSVFDPENPKGKSKFPSEVEKWCQIFIAGDFPEGELKELELTDFQKAITDFNQKSPSYDVQKEIEINGKTYRAFEEDFKLNVVKWGRIEKLVKKASGKQFLAEILAVIFEDVDLSENEHKADAHIRNKAKIFRENLTAEIAMPYFTYVVTGLYKKAQIVREKMEQEQTESEAPKMEVVSE